MFKICWNWFSNLLFKWGLYQKDAKILFLGLDNSGKTTLLHVLKDGRIKQSVPTFHPNDEELILNGIKFRTIDLGGHDQARRLWNEYFTSCDGIVFLVDSADQERIPEAREELHRLLMEEQISQVPVLILGNKIDLPQAVCGEKLVSDLCVYPTGDILGFNNMTGPKMRPLELFMCSIKEQTGYGDGFKWLASVIA